MGMRQAKPLLLVSLSAGRSHSCHRHAPWPLLLPPLPLSIFLPSPDRQSSYATFVVVVHHVLLLLLLSDVPLPPPLTPCCPALPPPPPPPYRAI